MAAVLEELHLELKPERFADVANWCLISVVSMWQSSSAFVLQHRPWDMWLLSHGMEVFAATGQDPETPYAAGAFGFESESPGVGYSVYRAGSVGWLSGSTPTLRSAAAIQPGTCRSERRMVDAGQFIDRSEESDPIVGGRGCGFRQICCFAQACPTDERGHPAFAQAVGSVNHGPGIAQRQFGREHNYLAIVKRPLLVGK